MTDIFIWFASEKYQEYCSESDEINQQLLYFNKLLGKPLVPMEQWKPPTLVPFFPDNAKSKKSKPIGDFMRAGNPHIVSERAVSGLGEMFHKNGLLYPVSLNGSAEPHFMFVCSTVLDCLDHEKSKVKRSIVNPNEVTTVLEPVFKQDRVGGASIFMIPETQDLYYVTQEFKDKVAKLRLTGLMLSKRWFDPSPWYS